MKLREYQEDTPDINLNIGEQLASNLYRICAKPNIKRDLRYLLRVRCVIYLSQSLDRHARGCLISDLHVSVFVLFLSSNKSPTQNEICHPSRALFGISSDSLSALSLMGKSWPEPHLGRDSDGGYVISRRFIIARRWNRIVRMHRTPTNSERSPACKRPPIVCE